MTRTRGRERAADAASSGGPAGTGPDHGPVGRLVAVSVPGSDPAGAAPLELTPGPLSARLLVDDLPVSDLAPGTRLRVGPRAVVELGLPAGGGSGPSQGAGGIAERSHGGWVGARVVAGGPARVGDAVGIEAVTLPVEDVLDLHAFRPDETLAVVEEYLTRACAAGLDEVRIVHGRGHGVQRALLRRLLTTRADVRAFADAPPERGGWGATVVQLRPAPGAGPA